MSRLKNDKMTFWEHLDELRRVLLRVAMAAIAGFVVALMLKNPLFEIVLQPKEKYGIRLINTELMGQFAIHIRLSLFCGLLFGSPYILYALFRFIAPGLVGRERKYAVRVVVSGYLMFALGLALNYFVIFPFTFHFLGTYQVNGEVENMISLHSYIDTLLMMSLMLGVLFELPVVCWLLGKLGVLHSAAMRQYRRHAIVLILIVAAVITPTSDVLTLLLVSVPIWLLYEISILVVKR